MLTQEKLIEFAEIPETLRMEAAAIFERALQTTVASDRPTLIHLCGIPGSGKSTYAQRLLSKKNKFALVQFDTVMESLQGYQLDREKHGLETAFKSWELSARAIGYHLLQSLIDNERDVLFDHSAMNESHPLLIQSVIRRGYRVEMHYLPCELEVALERIRQRESKICRHTPRQLVIERSEMLVQLLPRYKRTVDTFVEVTGNLT